jgi:hypothetical protein
MNRILWKKIKLYFSILINLMNIMTLIMTYTVRLNSLYTVEPHYRQLASVRYNDCL